VVDDHPGYRAALAAMLDQRADLELVGEAEDGPGAVEMIRNLCPDVAVVDLNLPGFGGLGVLEQLVRDSSQTRVLILSGFSDTALIERALKAGAVGYLVKDAGGQAICQAITAVSRGETVLDPALVTGRRGDRALP